MTMTPEDCAQRPFEVARLFNELEAKYAATLDRGCAEENAKEVALSELVDTRARLAVAVEALRKISTECSKDAVVRTMLGTPAMQTDAGRALAVLSARNALTRIGDTK